MAAPSPSSVPLFTITYQRETTQGTGGGQFVTGVQVGFQTRSGTQASIFVPYTAYSPDNVQRLVTERAQQIEAVHNVTPG